MLRGQRDRSTDNRVTSDTWRLNSSRREDRRRYACASAEPDLRLRGFDWREYGKRQLKALLTVAEQSDVEHLAQHMERYSP